jgi:head-tail adaptor
LRKAFPQVLVQFAQLEAIRFTTARKVYRVGPDKAAAGEAQELFASDGEMSSRDVSINIRFTASGVHGALILRFGAAKRNIHR